MYKYAVNFILKRNRVTIWRCPISPQYKNSHFFFIFRQAKNGGIKNCINLIRYIKRKRSGIWQQLFLYYSNEKKKTRIKKRPPCHLVPDFNMMCTFCILFDILKQMLFTWPKFLLFWVFPWSMSSHTRQLHTQR